VTRRPWLRGFVSASLLLATLFPTSSTGISPGTVAAAGTHRPPPIFHQVQVDKSRSRSADYPAPVRTKQSPESPSAPGKGAGAAGLVDWSGLRADGSGLDSGLTTVASEAPLATFSGAPGVGVRQGFPGYADAHTAAG